MSREATDLAWLAVHVGEVQNGRAAESVIQIDSNLETCSTQLKVFLPTTPSLFRRIIGLADGTSPKLSLVALGDKGFTRHYDLD